MGTWRRREENRVTAGDHRRPVGLGLGLAAAALLVSGWLLDPIRPPPAPALPPPKLALPAPSGDPSPAQAVASTASEAAADAAPAELSAPVLEPEEPPALQVVEGTIGDGQSLSTELRGQGIPAAIVHTIATEMKSEFDFRYSRPGDTYRLARAEDGDLVEFRYSPSPLVHYRLIRESDGYITRKWEATQVRHQARIAGVVHTSLYEAIMQLGEHPQLAGDFADIFAWDVDFSHAVRAGDEFSIVYERLFRELPGGGEAYEGPGRILAAHYLGADGDHHAVYFEIEEGQGGYYRLDGSSVQRQFLRAPLSYRRISSGFTLSRFHPILKVRRPHPGIDYAAPAGTPVWAVADGRVTFVGRQGGLGSTVKVRHANGYESAYGHLSRFAKGLRRGQLVSQKQVIGYVGSSGLATGPHLDFRIKKNGRYVNPARISSPAGPPIPSSAQADFFRARDGMLAVLTPQPLAITEEAL